MKKAKLFVFMLLLPLFFASAESPIKIALNGSWSYKFYNNNSYCQITGDKIVNNGKDDTSYRLVFFLSTKKYNGGAITGYSVGTELFKTLESGYMRTDIDVTFTDFTKKQPPTGDYYPVILLLALKNGQSGIADYLPFDGVLHFHNYLVDEVEDLLTQLDASERQTQSYGNSYDALSSLADSYIITSQLGHLGYNVYGGSGIKDLYPKTETIVDIASIKDAQPKDTSTYIVPGSSYYNPDYSYYDSSIYGNSTSTSSGMQTVTETCSFCRGTGKSLYDYVDAPRYTGSQPDTYCPICNRTGYAHTHKTCPSCKGTGRVQRIKY